MNIWVFLTFFAACGAAAASGALFPTGDWYKSLNKPKWTPPDWVFPIAWSIFYIALAFAGARVASLPENTFAVAFWSLHIALNTLWTPVFFGARNLKAGMIIILFLWFSTAGMIYHRFMVDKVAGIVIMPYILWVTIASALNYSLLRRNPNKT